MAAPEGSHFIGSTLILSGTAIGAGMLALPLVASGAGFLITLGMFLITAFFAVVSACYTFEASMAIAPGCNLYTMSCRVLGRTGRLLSTLAPLGLHYALMVAYLSAGGALLAPSFKLLIPQVTSQLSIVIFAVIAALFVYSSTRVVDYLNRVLFSMMFIFFVVALVILLPGISSEHLISSPSIKAELLIVSIPVIFTSFGFHGSIPSIIIYQKKNYSKIPWIFIWAVFISLLIYFLWLISAMGTISSNELAAISQSSGAAGNLIDALSSADKNNQKLSYSLPLFSDFALLTSLLGVALGLFDYLANLLGSDNSRLGRARTAAVTFIPAVAAAIIYPDGFVAALGYAAIALAIIAILLPTAIVYKLRKKNQKIQAFQTPGGNIMLACCALFGIIIIASQLYIII